MSPGFFGFLAAAGCYLASSLFYAADFCAWRESRRAAVRWLYAGFFVSSLLVFYETMAAGFYLPVKGLAEALFFFAWSMVFIYLVLARRIHLETFGLVLSPLAFLLSAAALVLPGETVEPPAYLASRWFMGHVLAAFFAYASFTLSFVAAVLYLVQNHELKAKKTGTFYHRLPPLDILETVVYRAIILGLILLTMGIASGILWSREAFGAHWHWDPKFVCTLVTWCAYLAILLVHYLLAFRGRQVITISLLAFGLVLFTFLGVNVFENSLHDFLR